MSYETGVQTCHLSAKFAVFTLKQVIHVNRADLLKKGGGGGGRRICESPVASHAGKGICV